LCIRHISNNEQSACATPLELAPHLRAVKVEERQQLETVLFSLDHVISVFKSCDSISLVYLLESVTLTLQESLKSWWTYFL